MDTSDLLLDSKVLKPDAKNTPMSFLRNSTSISVYLLLGSMGEGMPCIAPSKRGNDQAVI